MDAIISFFGNFSGILISLAAGAATLVIGWKVRSWIVEQQIDGNPEMVRGNEFHWVVCKNSGEFLLVDGHVTSTEGKRVILEEKMGTGRLNLTNSDYKGVWILWK